MAAGTWVHALVVFVVSMIAIGWNARATAERFWVIDAADVDAEIRVEADPGDVVRTNVRVFNGGADDLVLDVQYEVPAALELVAPRDTLDVPAGARRVVSAVLRVRGDAEVGTWPVGFVLRDAVGNVARVSRAVEVRPIWRGELSMDDGPLSVHGRRFVVAGRVTNHGNTDASFYIDTLETSAFEATPTPAAVELAPGETRDVSVVFETDATNLRAEREIVVFYLRRVGAEGTLDRERRDVYVGGVSAAQRDVSPRHSIPVSVQFSTDARANDVLGDPEFAFPGSMFRFRMSGPLDDANRTYGLLAVDVPWDLESGGFRARYRRPSLDLRVDAPFDEPGTASLRFHRSNVQVQAFTNGKVGVGSGVGALAGSGVAVDGSYGSSWLGTLQVSAQLVVSEGRTQTGAALTHERNLGSEGGVGWRSEVAAAWRPDTMTMAWSPSLRFSQRGTLSGTFVFRGDQQPSMPEQVYKASLSPGTSSISAAWSRRAVSHDGRPGTQEGLHVDASTSYRVAASAPGPTVSVRARAEIDRETKIVGAEPVVTEAENDLQASAKIGRVSAQARWRRESSSGAEERFPSFFDRDVRGSLGVAVGSATLRARFDVDTRWGPTRPDSQDTLDVALALLDLSVTRSIDVRGDVGWTGRRIREDCGQNCDFAGAWRLGAGVDAPSTGANLLVRARDDGGRLALQSYQLAANVRATPRGWLSGEVEGRNGLPNRAQLAYQRDVGLPIGRARVHLHGAADWADRASVDVGASVDWRYDTRLPLGYRSDATRLEGVIETDVAIDLRGLEVRIGDRTVTTDEEGRFTYVTLERGALDVFVRPGQFPSDVLIAPDPYQSIEGTTGGETDVTFRLVPAGTVTGTVLYDEPPAPETQPEDESVIFGTGQPNEDRRVVAGRTLILESEERRYRTRSQQDGRFRFERVYPGTYELRVHNPGALRYFSVEPLRQTVVVEDASPVRVEQSISPDRRIVDLQEAPSISVP